MKEEALKLADILEGAEVPNDTQMFEASSMIRRLVEELDKLEKDLALKTRDRDVFCDFTLAYEKALETKKTKPLSDEEILEILIDKGICGRLKDGSLCYWQADADLHDFARAIEERHGIK